MNDDLISRRRAIKLILGGKIDGDSSFVECVEECNSMLDWAADEIKALPSAEPRWIPVTERLPEYGIEVVTVDKDGDYEINHIIDEEDGKWYWRGAIAWMHLPEYHMG